jgi:hypothetical protein
VIFTGEIKNQISLTELSFAHPPRGSPHILAIPSLFLTVPGEAGHRTLPAGRSRRPTAGAWRLLEKPELYQVAGNSRPFSTGKKCAHKNKLREEAVPGRPYIKFGESFMAMQ